MEVQAKEALNVVEDEERCDRNKLQDDLQVPASIGVNMVSNNSENYVKDAKVLAATVGECNIIVREICKHLPKLLAVRLVNKKWCEIASGILQDRLSIWINLTKQKLHGNDEFKSWSRVKPASKHNSNLIALDRLLKANSNFPCQNYWISVGIQGHDGAPSTFIVKWIGRIKSLHFDVLEMPFIFVYGNFMAKTGFVAVQNVRNLQLEHGPYDWGLPLEVVSSNAPRLNRLKKLILPGNHICDRTSWRDVLKEAVNLERIENCTFSFLPDVINQNKVNLVKSLYLNFHLKPNPAVGLTLQENVNVFVQAVQQGLKLEEILAFDIEIFIVSRSKASRTHEMETVPPQATLTKCYKNVVEAFNKLLKNSDETLEGIQNISCLEYTSKGTTSGGCLTRIVIPRMTKMRQIDWLTLHENSLMRMDFLLPLTNDGFSASQCFPNVKDIMCDPSKQCWTNLSFKSSADMKQLTEKLSMPSTSRLYWFCSHLDPVGHQSINRNRDCNLIQHFLHPIFPNLTTMNLQHLILSEIPKVLTKIIEFYSTTLQQLTMSNRRNELPKPSKADMWLLDASITGFPQSFLEILRQHSQHAHVKTVKLLQNRPSIRSMKCLQKLTFHVYDPCHVFAANIPLIGEFSKVYGFESLPKLKTVKVVNADNHSVCDSDQEQLELEDAGEGYYQRYRYEQQPIEQNVNRLAESLESLQMEEHQQTKIELLFLKEKIKDKLKPMKRNSETVKELKSVLLDVDSLINNI